MAPSTGDIDVRPAALERFAGDARVDVNVAAVSGPAAAASQGTSVMAEGTAYNQAQKNTIDQIMRMLETAKQGAATFRDGAGTIFGLYTGGDTAAAQTIASVPMPGNEQAQSTLEV